MRNGVRGQARAAIVLEDLEDLFPLAEAEENGRDGTDVERVGAEPEQVRGDAVELGQDHAHGLGSRRDLDVEQLLDCHAVASPLETAAT